MLSKVVVVKVTIPSVRLVRPKQSTAAMEVVNRSGKSVIGLTIAHWSNGGPLSISSTSPGVAASQSVSSVTGVGSSHREGGSRGCVHCSIVWVSEAIAVNSYNIRKFTNQIKMCVSLTNDCKQVEMYSIH